MRLAIKLLAGIGFIVSMSAYAQDQPCPPPSGPTVRSTPLDEHSDYNMGSLHTRGGTAPGAVSAGGSSPADRERQRVELCRQLIQQSVDYECIGKPQTAPTSEQQVNISIWDPVRRSYATYEFLRFQALPYHRSVWLGTTDAESFRATMDAMRQSCGNMIAGPSSDAATACRAAVTDYFGQGPTSFGGVGESGFRASQAYKDVKPNINGQTCSNLRKVRADNGCL
jgi:hypothetical protein